MKKSLVLSLMLMFATVGFSQNTGYLGKHVFLDLSSVLSPSYRFSNLMTPHVDPETSGFVRIIGLNVIANPNVEYFLSPQHAFGVGYNFFQSPFASPDRYLILPPKDVWFAMDYKIQSHGFSLHYKYYFDDANVPAGFYLKAQMDGFFNYYCPYSDTTMWVKPELLDPEDMNHGRSVMFGAKMEFGYEQIFLNRIRLSGGVSLGTTFGGYGALNKYIKSDIAFNPTYGEVITVKNMANSCLLNSYAFGIRLGVDILLF